MFFWLMLTTISVIDLSSTKDVIWIDFEKNSFLWFLMIKKLKIHAAVEKPSEDKTKLNFLIIFFADLLLTIIQTLETIDQSLDQSILVYSCLGPATLSWKNILETILTWRIPPIKKQSWKRTNKGCIEQKSNLSKYWKSLMKTPFFIFLWEYVPLQINICTECPLDGLKTLFSHL